MESRDDAPGAGLAAESAPRTDPAGPLSAGFIDPAGSQSGILVLAVRNEVNGMNHL